MGSTRSAASRNRHQPRPEREPNEFFRQMTPERLQAYREQLEEESRQGFTKLTPQQQEAFRKVHASELAIDESRGDREREQNYRTILAGLHKCGSRNIRFLARLFVNVSGE